MADDINLKELYSRQKTIGVVVPQAIGIIGVGGVGSWVGHFLANMGVKHIVLFDPDYLEASNLNRTPYRVRQVGKSKVSAMAEIIKDLRGNTVEVYPFDSRVEDISEAVLKEIYLDTGEFQIIDCRDNIDPLPEYFNVIASINGGYDGTSLTVSINPDFEATFGDVVRYSQIPSYVVPPIIVAAAIVNVVTLAEIGKEDPDRHITFDMRHFNEVLWHGSEWVRTNILSGRPAQ